MLIDWFQGLVFTGLKKAEGAHVEILLVGNTNGRKQWTIAIILLNLACMD